MKRFFTILSLLILMLGGFSSLQAQLTVPYASPHAMVMQRIGITDMIVKYNRPAVNGRQIWGNVVPYGLNNLGFGTSTAAPWRAGANENTIFKVSHDVKIEGKTLPAGKYGLHMIVQENGDVTIIFSKNYSSWGSFFYEPKEDALRVEVSSEDVAHVERLAYEFTDLSNTSVVLALRWEKKRIPFKIEVDVHDIVLANMKKELHSNKGFNYQAWNTAAGYCLQNNIALEQGLQWAEAAATAPFIGEKNFNTLSTKAQILAKMGKGADAEKVMDEALPLATVFQVHQYARQLLTQGNKTKALEVFQWNAKAHPNTWPVNVGLSRGYSAVGEYKKALKHAKLALANVPQGDNLNKSNLEKAIETLKQGKDIN